MADIAQLGIEVLSDDIVKATKRLDKLESQSKQSEKQNKKLGSSFDLLKGAIAAIGIGALTKQLISSINTYTALSNKLKLVTSDAKNLADVQNVLFDISQDTRASLEGTIDLYSRLARSTKDLNISQNELASVTETINKAISVSGSSAQEASAALFQLGQGLSAGALRGEELNSVLEQTPRLAQAIADGLGVGIAELRKMGAAGELNAERVITAIKSQTNVIDSEFKQTEKTISQAFQQIQNVALKTFGEIDGSDLVDSMDQFREIISDPKVVQGLQTIASLLLDITNSAIKFTAALPNLGEELGKTFANFFEARPEIETIVDKIKLLEVVQKNAAIGSAAWKNATDELTESYKRLVDLRKERGLDPAGATPEETPDPAESPRVMKTQEELDLIREKEMDAMLDRYDREQQEMERLSDIKDQRLAIEMDYYDRLYDIQAGSQQAALDFTESLRGRDLKGSLKFGSLMLSNAAKQNKEAFEVQKAFALANAIVTLPSAVMKSFDNGGGYPWGLIPAGLMLATGLAQINQINSTSFGSKSASGASIGGGVGSIGGGGASSGFSGGGAIPGPIELPEQQRPTQQVSITLNGAGYSRDDVRELIESINEEIGDGATLVAV